MTSLPITVTTKIKLTPQQIAEAFWQMDDEDQAAFFIHLGHISSENCVAGALDIQMCRMAETLQKHPDRKGIATLCKIADYAYKFGRLDQPAETWML